MSKFKINNDKEAHFNNVKVEQDFQDVLKRVKNSKTGKQAGEGQLAFGKNIGVLAVVTLLGLTVFMISKTAMEYFSDKEQEVVKTSIYEFTSPSPKNDTPFEEFVVAIEKGKSTRFTAGDGTVIEIPENALETESGEKVVGEVHFKYRAFKDLKSIMMSGIPMTYDSAGVLRTFESAGMFELYAEQNKENLVIASGKQLEVALTSTQKGNYFNQYYLDPETGEWLFNRKDTAGTVSLKQVSEAREVFEKQAVKELISMGESLPVLPRRIKKEEPTINLVFDKNKYPELAIFENVAFQIAENDNKFDPSYANQSWDRVSINNTSKAGIYNVCFSNSSIKDLCFKTYPVLPDESFEKDSTKAAQLYQRYFARKNELRKEKRNMRRALLSKTEMLNAQKDHAKEQMRRDTVLSQIVRNFAVNAFGVWNADYPRMAGGTNKVELFFADQRGKALALGKVYLADRGEGMLVELKKKNDFTGIVYLQDGVGEEVYDIDEVWDNFIANEETGDMVGIVLSGAESKGEAMLWGIVNADTIAYLSKRDFEKIDPTQPNAKVKMKKMEVTSFTALHSSQLFDLK